MGYSKSTTPRQAAKPDPSAIPNLNEKMAWTEHLKRATLAPAGLRPSGPFQITRPGLSILLLLGIAVFYDDSDGFFIFAVKIFIFGISADSLKRLYTSNGGGIY
jgi:hypothetical protein